MHWRRKWQPTPVFLPGESQGRGSLVGCRLWGCAESDTTEVTSKQQPQCYIATQLPLWKCPDGCGVSVAALWRWQLLFWFPLSVADPWHGRLSPGHCRPHPGSAFLQEAKWVLRRSFSSRKTRQSTCLRFADAFVSIFLSPYVITVFKEGPLGSWTWSSLQSDIGQAGVKQPHGLI